MPMNTNYAVGLGERTRLGCIKPAPSPVCLEALALTKRLDSFSAPEVADEASATAPEGGCAPHERLRGRRGNEAETIVSHKIRLVTSAATRFMVPMRAKFGVELSMNRKVGASLRARRGLAMGKRRAGD